MENLIANDLPVKADKRDHFNSFNLNKAIKHIRFLTRPEKIALKTILLRMPFHGGEYDLTGAVTISNGLLAYEMDYRIDTARKAKEGLQARSIFMIDGKPWSTKKPFTMLAHTIQVTPAFVTYLKDNLKNKKTGEARQWGYCDGYVEKTSLRNFKSRLSKALHRGTQVCINLVKDTAEVLKESTPSPLDSIKAYMNQSKYIDNESYSKPSANFLQSNGPISPKMIANKLLANISKTDTTKVKKWSTATTDFCKCLLDSGMTKYEVVKKMIQAGYVRSAEDFERKIMGVAIVQTE